MTQHINLLPRVSRSLRPFMLALIIWLSVVAMLVLVWVFNQFRLASARHAEEEASKELAEARVIIKQREDQRTALTAEIEATRPSAEAAQAMLALIEQLGGTEGFAMNFAKVADISEEGMWLTKIDVQKAGRAMRVEGQSLNKEAVVRFGRKINSAFADNNLQFSTLEMQPPIVPAIKSPGVSMTSTPFLIY